MNRRAFLQRFGLGVAATLAVAHVPASVVKAVVGDETARLYACEYLRKVYNDYSKGKTLDAYPREMVAGAELFEAYESELLDCQRFVSAEQFWTKTLMFKGAKLRSEGTGWYAKVAA